MKPRKTRFLPPYRPNGKTTFPESSGKKGVYLIQRHGRIVYVGYSGYNLYKTLYRHFQDWNDPTQKRVIYPKELHEEDRIRVRVVYTNTAAQAQKLEKALILVHEPADNPDKLERYDPTLKQIKAVAIELDNYENCDWCSPTEVPF